MNGPRFIAGRWRLYIPGVGVYRYQLRKSASRSLPQGESVPVVADLERGTVNGWVPVGGDWLRAAIVEAHSFGVPEGAQPVEASRG